MHGISPRFIQDKIILFKHDRIGSGTFRPKEDYKVTVQGETCPFCRHCIVAFD